VRWSLGASKVPFDGNEVVREGELAVDLGRTTMALRWAVCACSCTMKEGVYIGECVVGKGPRWSSLTIVGRGMGEVWR
jgi:hypothetical protein